MTQAPATQAPANPCSTTLAPASPCATTPKPGATEPGGAGPEGAGPGAPGPAGPGGPPGPSGGGKTRGATPEEDLKKEHDLGSEAVGIDIRGPNEGSRSRRKVKQMRNRWGHYGRLPDNEDGFENIKHRVPWGEDCLHQ